jgi:hypothetical protein
MVFRRLAMRMVSQSDCTAESASLIQEMFEREMRSADRSRDG